MVDRVRHVRVCAILSRWMKRKGDNFFIYLPRPYLVTYEFLHICVRLVLLLLLVISVFLKKLKKCSLTAKIL